KGADCKSAGSAYGGSNPPRPTLPAGTGAAASNLKLTRSSASGGCSGDLGEAHVHGRGRRSPAGGAARGEQSAGTGGTNGARPDLRLAHVRARPGPLVRLSGRL